MRTAITGIMGSTRTSTDHDGGTRPCDPGNSDRRNPGTPPLVADADSLMVDVSDTPA